MCHGVTYLPLDRYFRRQCRPVMSGTPHSPYLELIARSLGPREGLYVLLAADPLIIVKNVWNKCRITGLKDGAIYPGFNVLYLAGLATLLGGKLFFYNIYIFRCRSGSSFHGSLPTHDVPGNS